MKKGETHEAQKCCRKILDVYPKNIRARNFLASLQQKQIPKDSITQLVNLYGQGKYLEVVELSEKHIDLYPEDSVIWNIKGAANEALQKLDEALKAFEIATTLNPRNHEYHSNIGIIFQKQGEFDKSINAYKKALLLKSNHYPAFNNMGVIFEKKGELTEAIDAYKKALKLNPNYVEAHYNIGNVLKTQGKFEKAINKFCKVLRLCPDYVEAYKNLGDIFQEQDRIKEAMEAYDKALNIKPNYPEIYNEIGNLFKKQGNIASATKMFKGAISLKPEYIDPYNNLGNVLMEQSYTNEALGMFKRALVIDPNNCNALNCMGVILHKQGDLEEAINFYNRAISSNTYFIDAINNLGNAFIDQGKIDEAIETYNRALLIKPDFEVARSHKIYQQANICDWASIEEDCLLISKIGTKKDAIPPFTLLSLEDSPYNHRERSKLFGKAKFSNEFKKSIEPLVKKSKDLRIGYFSADFHNHATMYLMSKVFNLHDRNILKIYAFSYGPDKNDEMRKKLVSSVDVFNDVSKIGDEDVALLARQNNIDIAIDLKGYTQNSRSSIFMHRIAPIQINYLGYPGTLGTNYIDYIIADPTIIPQEYRDCYTEEIIYMPHCYQPNDNKRLISKKAMTKLDMGLPEDSFVFCSFNNNYKITKVEFNIWMRLLKEIEGSVLWLFKSNKWAEANLKKEAFNNGVDASRLIFAEKLPHDEHLARHKFADLFIDTFNYNAHTTASDALWAGLPVVTKIGKGFPARVAGSLLKAVGLPELITENEKEYEALILDLASNSDKLLKIKEKLRVNRLSQPLFDTELYTKNLEKAYLQVYKNYIDGKSPQTIYV